MSWSGAAGQAFPDDLDRADDTGEQVVEVVGDTACQLTDGLHLLRLPQGLFGLAQGGFGFAFGGHVATDALKQTVDKDRAHRDDPAAPRTMVEAQLEQAGRTGLHQAGEGLIQQWLILGKDQILQAFSLQLVFRPAERVAPGWIGRGDLAVRPGHEHDVGGEPPHPVAIGSALGHAPFQGLVELGQLLLGRASFIDVPQDGREEHA